MLSLVRPARLMAPASALVLRVRWHRSPKPLRSSPMVYSLVQLPTRREPPQALRRPSFSRIHSRSWSRYRLKNLEPSGYNHLRRIPAHHFFPSCIPNFLSQRGAVHEPLESVEPTISSRGYVAVDFVLDDC